MYIEQLFPNLDKVVFLDDDVVIQRDLSPLWEINLGGKINGAVETCKGDDEWVMSKHFRNYFNFSHPLIAKHLDPDECARAYGMNIFDLRAWRKTKIRETYHSWLKEVNPSIQFYWQTSYFCLSTSGNNVIFYLQECLCQIFFLTSLYIPFRCWV